MLNRLFPRCIDNTFRGHILALWLFGAVVIVRTAQSLLVIFSGYYTTSSADGIPLDTYPPAAAQTIVAAYASSGLFRRVTLVVCAVVLVRYRSAVPAMFVLLVGSFLASQLIYQFMPVIRTGTPPAAIANRILFVLMIVGLALSLWRQDSREAVIEAAHQ